MCKLHFFRDDYGAPRASGDDTVLASFLESDIQDSIEILEDLLALLQLPQAAQFNGNAYSLSIDTETISLENQFDDEKAGRQLSRAEFATTLSLWQKFLETSTQ